VHLNPINAVPEKAPHHEGLCFWQAGEKSVGADDHCQCMRCQDTKAGNPSLNLARHWLIKMLT